jgi:lipopolysaccharide cholinephosphotransferase
MEIRDIQNRVLELIRVFDRICVENDIWYTLTSGSVLGAVRHGGFIPWDLDMDVFVKIDNVHELRLLLVGNLPKEMKLIVWDNEPRCDLCFDRLSFRSTSHNEVHLDIFPLIGVPETLARRKAFTLTCFYSYKLLRCKHVDPSYSKPSHEKPIKLLKRITKLIPDSLIRRWYHWLESRYAIEQSDYVYTIGSGYGFRECLPKELLFGSTRVPFENTVLPIPIQYHDYLTSVYGDYMTPRRDGYKKRTFFVR